MKQTKHWIGRVSAVPLLAATLDPSHARAQQLTVRSPAQLTVHTLNRNDQQPMPGVLVRLNYGCFHSGKPVILKQRTDASGVAIFPALTLEGPEFCVFVGDAAFESSDPSVLFASPAKLAELGKVLNPQVQRLPADITFHVQRLTFAQRLRNIFRWE